MVYSLNIEGALSDSRLSQTEGDGKPSVVAETFELCARATEKNRGKRAATVATVVALFLNKSKIIVDFLCPTATVDISKQRPSAPPADYHTARLPK